MKYFPLIWAGLWRKPARTILTLLSVSVAFLLFGMLHGVIAGFDTGLKAVGHALDQYEIPFLLKRHDIGIFGPGPVMATPLSVSLWVPANRNEEVAKLRARQRYRDSKL